MSDTGRCLYTFNQQYAVPNLQKGRDITAVQSKKRQSTTIRSGFEQNIQNLQNVPILTVHNYNFDSTQRHTVTSWDSREVMSHLL